MARDLIISIFADVSQSSLNKAGIQGLSPREAQPFHMLRRPYDVVSIEKSDAGHVCNDKGQCCDQGDVWGGFCFDQLAPKLKASGNGSLIRGLLKKKGKDPSAYEGGRIAVVSFSAGSTMAHHIFDNPVDQGLVDTFISLDSMTFPMANGAPVPWKGYLEFAKRATGMDRMTSGGRNPYLGPLMVVMNTNIASNSASASSTQRAIQHLFATLNPGYYAAIKRVGQKMVDDQARAQQEIVARLRQSVGRLPLPMSIRCGNPASTATFTSSSAFPATVGYLGNLWQLGYPGTRGPDHCFAAYVAQRMIIESFLVPRWNSDDVAVAGLGSLAFAGETLREGGVTFTSPSFLERGGALLNRGALGPSVLPGPVKVAVGLGAGLALGYGLAKLMGLDR